ncbi:hypothetical protein BC30048_2945 [Bacillus cereus]|uniref:hypothetical protein n=1 Tax=Bacillus cereus TaxID=1396 RepID=UPI001BAC9956|nr:hypothetical protein [Bacillus cereus]MBR9685747.1 hypothetical protein [Bacillus cereus]MEB9966476.1 hypothetical protein [Bacillus cereus]BCD00043.1 hypothetical protein BC30048_2945 [Bacillus cereus]
MEEVFNTLRQKNEIQKAIYFLNSTRTVYYETINKQHLFNKAGFQEILTPALLEIQNSIDKHSLKRSELSQFLLESDDYLAFLLEGSTVDTDIILLSFLQKSTNLSEIFNTELEDLPDNAHTKYGITTLNQQFVPNHQGVFEGDRFYYYNPFIEVDRGAKFPPELITLLSNHMSFNNSVWYRLDKTLSIKKEEYKPTYREFAQVYQGREINLDSIQFPLHQGDKEYFCVYNPETMKKIQFKISHKKDSERWIEVEEIWDIHGRENQSIFVTRYLHSIYNPSTNNFIHVDGSINFYENANYQNRVKQQINAHADHHIKQWLVEGEISAKEWGKLILHFFNDYDLILDAFKGELVEEVFEDLK